MEKKFHRSHRATTLKKRKRKSSMRRKKRSIQKRSIQKRSIQKRSIQKRSIQKRKQNMSHRKLRSLPILRGGEKKPVIKILESHFGSGAGRQKETTDRLHEGRIMEFPNENWVPQASANKVIAQYIPSLIRWQKFIIKLNAAKDENDEEYKELNGIIDEAYKIVNSEGNQDVWNDINNLDPDQDNITGDRKDYWKMGLKKEKQDNIKGIWANSVNLYKEFKKYIQKQGEEGAEAAAAEAARVAAAEEAAAAEAARVAAEEAAEEAVNEIENLKTKANKKIKEADELSKQLSESLVNKGTEEAEKGEEEGKEALQEAMEERGAVDHHLNKIEEFQKDPTKYKNISNILKIAEEGKQKLEGVVNKADEAIVHFNRVKTMINEREAQRKEEEDRLAMVATKVQAMYRGRDVRKKAAADAEAARVAAAKAAADAEAEKKRQEAVAAEKKRIANEKAAADAEAEAARVKAEEEKANEKASEVAVERQRIENKLRNNCNESKFDLINIEPTGTYTRFDDFNKLDSQDEPENKYIYFIEEKINDKTEINKYFDEYIKLIYRYKIFQKENKEFNNDIFVHVKISDGELLHHKNLFNHIKSLNLKDIDDLKRDCTREYAAEEEVKRGREQAIAKILEKG